MKVRDCMTRKVAIVRADNTLQDAAAAMRDTDIGMLPVHQDNKLVGVITDRDITVRAVAEGKNPTESRVSEVMTRELAGCSEEDDAKLAAQRMKELKVRRLMVVDREKRPVGVVSLADFATEGECAPLAKEALAGICQPAG